MSVKFSASGSCLRKPGVCQGLGVALVDSHHIIPLQLSHTIPLTADRSNVSCSQLRLVNEEPVYIMVNENTKDKAHILCSSFPDTNHSTLSEYSPSTHLVKLNRIYRDSFQDLHSNISTSAVMDWRQYRCGPYGYPSLHGAYGTPMPLPFALYGRMPMRGGSGEDAMSPPNESRPRWLRRMQKAGLAGPMIPHAGDPYSFMLLPPW